MVMVSSTGIVENINVTWENNHTSDMAQITFELFHAGKIGNRSANEIARRYEVKIKVVIEVKSIF